MDNTIQWLLSGDVSVQYQTHRDILGAGEGVLAPLQKRIETEGFGARLLDCRSGNGHWGRHFYQPKWTCTHYALTDLMQLCVSPANASCREMVKRAFDECTDPDGSLNYSITGVPSDVCIDGMALAYAAYFCMEEPRIGGLIDFLLSQQRKDGGFTWDRISPFGEPHTTIAVLEGLFACKQASIAHRQKDAAQAAEKAEAFLLNNGLFMEYGYDKRYLKLSWPWRYRYDALRALDYFARAKTPFDVRMEKALSWLAKKKKPEGFYILENIHKGNVHFKMERLHEPSRFITVKALFILNLFHFL
ncbi:MAG: prenyltransferase/squalene oxidase repeat-containing protein [Christensenellales bacterium]